MDFSAGFHIASLNLKSYYAGLTRITDRSLLEKCPHVFVRARRSVACPQEPFPMVRRNQTMQLPAYQLGESTFLKKPSGLSASRIVLMAIHAYWANCQRPES
jgi:hypothetical protein